MKDVKFIIGLSLIILSFIVCTISFYFIIFGIPVYLLGAILVFISNKPLSTKLVSTIIPVLLWLPATYLFYYWYGKTTPETYIIPSNFQGLFRVVYREECGIEPKIQEGRRILNIPSNGILIIKSEFEAGYINHEYLLIDDNGKLTKANEIIHSNHRKKSLPSVMLSGTGNIAGPINGGFSSESELTIHFSDFYVYNQDTSEVENFKYSERFDSLTIAIVDSCRKRN